MNAWLEGKIAEALKQAAIGVGEMVGMRIVEQVKKDGEDGNSKD